MSDLIVIKQDCSALMPSDLCSRNLHTERGRFSHFLNVGLLVPLSLSDSRADSVLKLFTTASNI